MAPLQPAPGIRARGGGLTQKELVRKTLRAGACTSQECADISGLPRKHCAAYLSEMERDGEVEIFGRIRKTTAGPPFVKIYHLTEKRPGSRVNAAQPKIGGLNFKD